LSADLEWRTSHRGDRRLLQSFTCTVDRPNDWRAPHPSPWELEVQSWIRALKPPIHENRVLELGFADTQLAAVVMVERLGDEFVHIPVVARALGWRGAALGQAIVERAIDTAVSLTSPEFDRVIVSANIHRRNPSSRRCFESVGFTRDPARVDEHYEQWLLAVDIER
jgi:RimJ/RimL family protein N-acetyltransferase